MTTLLHTPVTPINLNTVGSTFHAHPFTHSCQKDHPLIPLICSHRHYKDHPLTHTKCEWYHPGHVATNGYRRRCTLHSVDPLRYQLGHPLYKYTHT
ncbi:hypothetical protein FKM82_021152 [Ascaphus truei]